LLTIVVIIGIYFGLHTNLGELSSSISDRVGSVFNTVKQMESVNLNTNLDDDFSIQGVHIGDSKAEVFKKMNQSYNPDWLEDDSPIGFYEGVFVFQNRKLTEIHYSEGSQNFHAKSGVGIGSYPKDIIKTYGGKGLWLTNNGVMLLKNNHIHIVFNFYPTHCNQIAVYDNTYGEDKLPPNTDGWGQIDADGTIHWTNGKTSNYFSRK
jgi:hypothetical protein